MAASGPISEGQRLALLHRLCEVLGEEEGRTLMESLPAVHWHDLATKDDVRANKAAIEANKAAIEANKAAIEASEHRLRGEMAVGFASIRAEMDGRFAQVDAEFTKIRGEMALQFARQTRTIVFTMLGLAVPMLGTILAVGLS